MLYRTSVLLSADAITAGTKTLDITVKDVISRIHIQVKATNNGNVPTAHPAAIISKIEMVDGSDVIFSLSGAQAQALEFYDTKRTPFCTNNYLNGAMNITNYQLRFGRHLWDPILALDPTKFRNPQLKITHNYAAGGCTPNAATLEVVLDLFDEKEVKPTGFLMNKELMSYTLSGSANEYVDLPTDYKLRKLLVFSLSAGKQPWQQFNELKLSEDNDKRVPFNDKTSDLIKYFGDNYPNLDEYIVGVALTSTRPFFIMSAYETICAAMSNDYAAAYLKSDLAYGGTVDIRASVSCNFMAMVRGQMPHGGLCIPFGLQDDLDDWYDVTTLGSLVLTIKAGATPTASSTCQIVTQQLRPY